MTTLPGDRSSKRTARSWLAVGIVIFACIGISSASAIDQLRERYGPSLMLSLFAALPVVPSAFFLTLARRSRPSIWKACLVCAAIVASFGVVTHTAYALKATPREYLDSAGQVHIFVLPILHIVIACVIYAILGITVLLIRSSAQPNGG